MHCWVNKGAKVLLKWNVAEKRVRELAGQALGKQEAMSDAEFAEVALETAE
jgi:hypothetical protein